MTSMKTVLLGSAAAILATGAAQAADLPVKKAAAAVQYVEVCPVYGSGFYKLPGTDICVRHFGSVKFGMGFQDQRNFITDVGVLSVPEAVSNTGGWQWSVRPGWDFRSPTEWGTLRTVVQLRADQRAGIFESQAPNLVGAATRNLLIHRGYIEWAGFTIGRAGTNFVYWDQDDVVSAIGGSPKESIPFMITYTFSAGGGLTATLGVEESNQWTQGYTDLNVPGTVALGPWRGMDVVASLATQQAWGSAKVAGLLHQQITNVTANAVTEQDTAFAVLAGVTFKLPSLGADDQLLLESTYCDGTIKACGGTGGGAANNPTTFERSGQYLEGLQRNDVDAYLVSTAGFNYAYNNTKMWSVVGQFRHYWTPMWRSNFSASYSEIDVPDTTFCVGAAATLANGCRGDANVWDVEANLIWGKSRKTAEIGVAVLYKSVNQDLPAATLAATIPGDVNPSGWAATAFISRNW